MEVSLNQLVKAKKGDMLIFDGKFWQPQKSEDLIKSLKKRIDDLEKLNEGIAEKERIRQEEEKAKFRSHSCLIASLLIENKIAKGELDEPDGYDAFISMVEDFQKGGAWDDSKIPLALLDFFPFINLEVAQ